MTTPEEQAVIDAAIEWIDAGWDSSRLTRAEKNLTNAVLKYKTALKYPKDK